MPASIEMDATLVTSDAVGGWTFAIVPDSATVFGTRRPVKVTGILDGTPIEATLLPMGDGTHMLPVKAAVRRAIGKEAGDRVHAHLHVVEKT